MFSLPAPLSSAAEGMWASFSEVSSVLAGDDVTSEEREEEEERNYKLKLTVAMVTGKK